MPPGVSDEHRSVHEGLARAIRRLSYLEYLILLGIVVLALLGGALLALLLQAAADLPFRTTWTVGSILFFVVPGVLVLGRNRMRGGTAETDEREPKRDGDDG